MSATEPLDAVILAAGNSSRLGQNKQLLRVGDQTLIRRAVLTTRAAQVRHIAVVTGFAREVLRRELFGLDVAEIHNPAWAQGMGTSLSTAVTAELVKKWASGALLVVLPDQYLVTTAHLDALIDARKTTGKGIAATRYGDEQGAPAVFASDYFPALAALAPEAGARPLLRKFAGDVHLVDNPDAAFDLDTRADLARLDASDVHP